MTFEQPKHLYTVTHQRVVRAAWSMSLIWGSLLSAVVIFGLWCRASAGEQVAPWRWIGAAGVGVLVVALIHLGLRFDRSRRRFVEFRGDRLLLAQRGAVAIGRFITWSLSSDPTEPRYTRLQLVYRFGLGRKRWSMLLDDPRQIAALRHALTAQIPQRDTARDAPPNGGPDKQTRKRFGDVARRVAKLDAWLHHPLSVEDLVRWFWSKRAVSWRDYVFAAALACLLPFLALGIEWCLTWQNQLSLVQHFGLPDFGNIIGWMAIPALISFLALLPVLRYPVCCRLVAVFLCLVWILILLRGELAVH